MKTKRRRNLVRAIGLALIASAQMSVASASAQTQSTEDLVKLKQDPVSGLRQVIVQAQINPDTPVPGGTQGIYSIQPVWPFSLNEDWKVISYTILPVVQQPGVNHEPSVVGLGDTLINLFVAPKKPGKVVWGAGPAILLPTRTNPALGSDRVGLGPTAVLFYAKNSWSAGVVLQNVWSLGGSGANKFNTFAGQYILNYNLPKNWFLYSNATITGAWLADERDRWTVPVGGGFGKVFNLGKQPVSLSFQAFSNVVTARNGPPWSGITQFSFLFP
jgi:hypothetical protein